jgi:predicted AAA+ superfamily ATPase
MKRLNLFKIIAKRISEPRRLMLVLAGPRQVGKTTLARQAMEDTGAASHYATADTPTLRDRVWIEQQWEVGRAMSKERPAGALLVLDEIQKIASWSEAVKRLWDEDTHRRVNLKVILLGSAPLLVKRGLTESLAGRFELVHVPHWSYPEMKEAFGWNLEQYVFYGGYPGSAPLVAEPPRWRNYILDSLVETTVSRDILLMTRVDKPALLRQLFQLACSYSGQILSFNKMLGQLQDAGNTVTLAHYLELLRGAGMAAGLQKYTPSPLGRRSSIPKLQVLNTALMSATSVETFDQVRSNGDAWGRWIESCVGAHLVNSSLGTPVEVMYWRGKKNDEVDFVIGRGRECVAIEVKSGRRRTTLPGIAAFLKEFKRSKAILVGSTGIPLADFLSRPAESWFG